MVSLYELVRDSKNNKGALEKLLQLFENKIKKLLYMTSFNNREDLNQELRFKMIKYTNEYDLDSIPGFWEFKEILDIKDENRL